MVKINLSGQGKQKLEAASAFLNFPDKYISSVFSISHFLRGPQNSKSLKYWVNDKTGLIIQYQDIAKNLKKGKFAKKFKNWSDIYEHVQYIWKNTLFSIMVLCLYGAMV